MKEPSKVLGFFLPPTGSTQPAKVKGSSPCGELFCPWGEKNGAVYWDDTSRAVLSAEKVLLFCYCARRENPRETYNSYCLFLTRVLSPLAGFSSYTRWLGHKLNWVLITYLLRTRFLATHCCFGSLPCHWFAPVSIIKLFFLLSLSLSQSLNVLCGLLRNSDCSINTIYQTAHRPDNKIQPPGKHVLISCSHIWHS